MKLTNGALSMMLSAYRSIFRAAYIRGIASAAVLTAGLSAGAANAAEISASTDLSSPTEEAIVLTEDTTFGAQNMAANEVTVSAGVTLSGAPENGNALYVKTLNLEEGSVLRALGGAVNGVISESWDSTLSATNATVQALGGDIQFGRVNVSGGEVFVSGGPPSDEDNATWQANAVIKAENGTGDNADLGVMNITDASVTAAAGGSIVGHQINITNAENARQAVVLSGRGGLDTVYSAFIRAYGTLSITNADIQADGESFIVAPTATITGGSLEVRVAEEADSNVLTIGAAITENAVTAADGNSVTLDGVTVTTAADTTLKLVSAATLTDGDISNSGTIEADKGLTLDGEFDLSGQTGVIELGNNAKLTLAEGAALTLDELSQVEFGDTGTLYVSDGSTVAFNGESVEIDDTVAAKLQGEAGGTYQAAAFDIDAGEDNAFGSRSVTFAADAIDVTTARSAGTLNLTKSTFKTSALNVADGVAVTLDDGAGIVFTGADTVFGNDLNITDGTSLTVENSATLGNVSAAGTMTVATAGTASVTGFDADSGVTVSGTLTVNGVADATKADDLGVDIEADAVTVNAGGTFEIAENVANLLITATETASAQADQTGDDTGPGESDGSDGGTGETDGSDGAAPEEPAKPAGYYTVNDNLGKVLNNGTYRIGYTDAELLITEEQFRELKTELFAGGSTGSLSVGAAQLEGIKPNEDNEVSLDDLQNSSANDGGTSDALQQATVTVEEDTVIKANNANVGSVSVATEKTDATMQGDWTLNAAAANTAGEGNSNAFVANSKGEAMNVTTDGNLTVVNGGSLGSVILTGADKTFTVTANSETPAVTVVEGITATDGAAALSSATTSTGDISVKTLNVSAAVKATAADDEESLTITAETLNATGDAAITADAVVLGGATEATASAISAGTHTIDRLTFKANTETAEEGGEEVTHDNVVTVDGGAVLNIGTLTGAEGVTIRVGTDGENGSTAALYSDVTSTNGALIIGDPAWTENSTLSWHGAVDSTAGDDKADGIVKGGGFVAAMNNYTTIGLTRDEASALMAKYPLAENGIQSILAVGQKLTLQNGASLVVSGLTGSEAAALADGSVYLGDSTVLYFTEDAATGSTAGITIDGNDGRVTAAGGEIIVGGDISASDTLNLITDSNGSVTIVGEGENTDGTIEISTENGLLSATVNSASGSLSAVELEMSEGARSVLSGLSDPVYGAAMDIFNDGSLTGAGAAFVRDQIGHGNGGTVEAAARMAVFGGALQAGMMASDTASDLISARLGTAGNYSGMIASDNGGAGIWLAPVYRHQESDSFDADGLDYGAEIDLTGVALGLDATTDSGVRLGAMFGVGSGDADSDGNTASVSNDFDYYSLGLYSGVNVGSLKLGADLTYTVTDNDLEGSGLSADTEVSVMSLGVTAGYVIDAGVMDVTPHLGLRYSRMEMDDYDVAFDGADVASVDNQNASVFSVPFGVTLSGELQAGSWTVQPAFDLTLAVNGGDTEMDSDVVFTGTGFSTPLTAEFADDFTYSGTLGISASNGGLSLGLSAGYTGSDNTDEYGVGASVRYLF